MSRSTLLGILFVFTLLVAASLVAFGDSPLVRGDDPPVPVEATGAGVPVLPERGDDGRVAHLNELMRWVASQYGPEVEVIGVAMLALAVALLFGSIWRVGSVGGP